LLAGFCYWRDLPRQNAKRFVALIEAGDYEAADAMFNGKRVGITNTADGLSRWQVTRRPQSAADWARGRYPLRVRAERTKGEFYALGVEAHATGLVETDSWTFYEIWLGNP